MLRWIVLAVAVFSSGCNTRPNKEQVVTPPAGLNDNAVELAVIMAVVDATRPPDLTIGQQITDSVLSSVLRGYSSVRSRNAWFYEGREQGAIFAGHQRKGTYMKVRISYSASEIKLQILESRDLDQSDTRIHKTALVWLSDLEDRIRRSLGNVAQQQLIQDLGKPAQSPTEARPGT
jgi:hypothetical protein